MKSSIYPFDFQFDQENIEFLSRNRTLQSTENHTGHDAFGLANVFKEYAGLPEEYPLRLTMEHGLKFDEVNSLISSQNSYQAILVPSKIRANIINRGQHHRAIPVGFGFLYAKALFKKFKLAHISDNARKGTLVFPFKSTPITTVNFDHAAYAIQLRNLPQQFQPVYVCLYWVDILKGAHLPYHNVNIPVVTAGHRFDLLFLYRFYDLCRRFRYAASNDIGTNLFLSVESGCRFFYIEGSKLERVIGPKKKRDDRIGATFNKNRANSQELFCHPVEKITHRQQSFVDSFIGNDVFTSPSQLRRILLREHRRFENRPWWHSEKKLLTPPSADNFTWEKFTPSHGWYHLEKDNDTLIRWMGATDDAWLDLEWKHKKIKSGAFLSCRIHCAATNYVEISVNQERIIDLKRKENGVGFRLEGLVPANTLIKPLTKNTLRIGFHVKNAIVPNKHDPGNAETRRLGVAVSHISIRPHSI